ncbi:MAG: hypothetical protein ABEJ05_14115, partial [Haloglomus sp.]
MNGTDAVSPRIRTHPGRDGVQLVDPIQDVQFALLTPEPAEPVACDTDRFYFPVDAAATLTTDTVETPYHVPLWIRDAAGDTVAEVGAGEEASLPAGQYHVDLSTTGIKVQFAVEGPLDVASLDERFRVTTGDEVHVGVRSLHEQPAATVTTTGDPADVMAAVSTLGSALKTTTCERSFPTLRGHPPLVERGDALAIPDGIDAPETGLAIEVPESFEYVYPAAPLAYYLGATVRPGDGPRLVADGWEYDLGGSGGFESTVARVLRQVFLLDCVTRTEGFYEVDLHERRVVEDAVDLDFAALYDSPLAEQVRTYLDVPADALADAMPAWKLTVDVEPSTENVSTLPFLANELAVVRCPDSKSVSRSSDDEAVERVASVLGTDATAPARGTDAPAFVRGDAARSSRSGSPTGAAKPVVRLPEADSIEQTYVGEGVPVGASKMTPDAYYRRLDYDPSSDPRISVVVVCNDEKMADENVVSDIYGTREWVEFDIVFEEGLTTDEMREVLRRDVDLLHYIGHVDEEGVRCADGHLDARDLSAVNVSAFVLNACDSYEQGYALVDHGAMAGMVTVTDVGSTAATSVGCTAARLLNQGFSLAATVSLVEEYEPIGHHYIVVGDASVSVVKNKSGTPYSAEVEGLNDDTYQMSLFGYPRLDNKIGALFRPFVPDEERHYLNSGRMGSYELTEERL